MQGFGLRPKEGDAQIILRAFFQNNFQFISYFNVGLVVFIEPSRCGLDHGPVSKVRGIVKFTRACHFSNPEIHIMSINKSLATMISTVTIWQIYRIAASMSLSLFVFRRTTCSIS